MGKFFRKIFIILVILSIIPGYFLLKWAFQPKKELKILILDKTVPTYDRVNHRSFNWILTHEKYVKGNKKRYDYKKDYYGFFPLKPERKKEYKIKRIRLSQVIALADSFDMTYFTDTYGVFFNDWYKGISRTRKSRKIYGGLNNNDYLFLKEMNDRNKLIISEFNTLIYPTDPLERTKVEDLLGIRWTEWVGKYFSSLDSVKNPDLPVWVLDRYRKQYHKPWTFKKGGIILVNQNDNLIVLEDERDLDFDVPFIYSTPMGMEKYGLPYKVPFPYWFEIMEARDNKIVANFKNHVNQHGDSILVANAIPNEFPAVMASGNAHPHYYLAGNFASNPVQMRTSYFDRYDDFSKAIGFVFLSKERYFYWHFYEPLMKNILDQYYNSIKEKK
jgi:hypothetical protein